MGQIHNAEKLAKANMLTICDKIPATFDEKSTFKIKNVKTHLFAKFGNGNKIDFNNMNNFYRNS